MVVSFPIMFKGRNLNLLIYGHGSCFYYALTERMKCQFHLVERATEDISSGTSISIKNTANQFNQT